MKKHLAIIFYLIIISFFTYSCSPALQAVSTYSPSKLTPIKVLETYSVSTKPSPTQTGTPYTPVWEVKKVCSEKQNIKIDELNLPYGLLSVKTSDPSSAEPMVFYPGTAEPKQLSFKEKPQFKGGFNYAVSKDQKWISFLLSIDERTNELWIISNDGTREWKVTTLASSSYINWISPDQLLVLGIPAEYNQYSSVNAYKFVPMFLVDVFRSEIKTLQIPPFDLKNSRQYAGVANFDNNGNKYTLFQDVNIAGSYEAFDYSLNKFTPIFTWLLSRDFAYSMFSKIWLSDNNLVVALPSEKGLEISYRPILNLTNNENNSVISVDLPSYLKPVTGLAVIPNTNQMLFIRLDDTYSRPFWLLSLDIQKKIIYDYCIDLPDVPTEASLSPDNRFAAISFSTQGMIVVNLSDGSFSTVPSYKAIDWLNFSK